MCGTYRWIKWIVVSMGLCSCALDSTLPFQAAQDGLPPAAPNISCADEPDHPDFQTGSGTTSSPYLICTPQQLLKLSEDSLYWQSHFELGNNIELSGQIWESIGFYDDNDSSTRIPFTGSFDGNNYKIQNLAVENTSLTTSTGMFAHTDGATIVNLVLENFDIRGHRKVGFVGTAFNTTLTDVSLTGTVQPPQGETASTFSACLFGYYEANNQDTVKVSNVNLDCDTYAHDVAATLFGWLQVQDGSSFELSNVQAQGDLIHTEGGNSNAGIGAYIRVVGSNNSLVLKNIEFSGDVTIDQGAGSWSGHGFGQMHFSGSSNNIEITEIQTSGNFSSVANFNHDGVLGGLVGNLTLALADSTVLFDKIAIQANITILNNSEPTNHSISGFIGRLGFNNVSNLDLDIRNSYGRGQIQTLNNNTLNGVGGFIGEIRLTGSDATLDFNVNSCYSAVDLILAGGGLTNSLGFVGTEQTIPNYTDNYFYSSNNLLGPGNSGESTSSAEVIYLDSTNILQSSQFVGPGWNFSTIWQANDGVTAPNLR